MTGFFAAAFAGFGLVAELRYGVVERMRVTPMSRFAMLAGRSLRDVTILMAQAILIIVVAIPFGLELVLVGRPRPWSSSALVGLTFSLLSYTLALVFKSEDALAPVVQGLALPLLLLSGIFLPMTFAPDWLQTLSIAQPADPCRGCRPGHVQRPVGRPEVVIGVTVIMVSRRLALVVARAAFARATSDVGLAQGASTTERVLDGGGSGAVIGHRGTRPEASARSPGRRQDQPGLRSSPPRSNAVGQRGQRPCERRVVIEDHHRDRGQQGTGLRPAPLLADRVGPRRRADRRRAGPRPRPPTGRRPRAAS